MRRKGHFGTPELRRLLRDFYRRRWQFYFGGVKSGPIPVMPRDCEGMLCGAQSRNGTPCRNDGTQFPNGRCKFHGGPSTGPKTTAGKAKAAANGARGKQTP